MSPFPRCLERGCGSGQSAMYAERTQLGSAEPRDSALQSQMALIFRTCRTHRLHFFPANTHFWCSRHGPACPEGPGTLQMGCRSWRDHQGADELTVEAEVEVQAGGSTREVSVQARDDSVAAVRQSLFAGDRNAVLVLRRGSGLPFADLV